MEYDRISDTYGTKEEIKKIVESRFPSPNQIREARKSVRFTIPEAADTVYVTPMTWSRWERGLKRMQPAFAELFALKTGLKPLPEILEKLNGKK